MSQSDYLRRKRVSTVLRVDPNENPIYSSKQLLAFKQYQIENRSKGNDRANLEWVGDNEETPIINKYLLNCGFNKDDKVLFWVCW